MKFGHIEIPPRNSAKHLDEDPKGDISGLLEIGNDMDHEDLGGGRSVRRSRPRGRGGEDRSVQASQEAAAEPAEVPESTDLTPKENREALAAAVSDVDEARKQELRQSLQEKAVFEDDPKKSLAEAERADVQAKEAAYLNAFKGLEQKRTFFNKLFKGKDFREESEQVEALKRSYDESRVSYAAAITKNVEESVSKRSENFEERTREKYEKLKASGMLMRTESGVEISFDAFMHRSAAKAENTQERVSSYLRFREVIRPLAEKKLEARREALNARGKSAFDKALGWSAQKNQELEKALGGKMKARIVRAAGTVVLISVGTAALGVAGVVAPVGLAALALGGGARFARSLLGVFAGAAAAEAGGAVFDVFGRKAQQQAAADLRGAGKNMSGSSVLSLEDLQRADAKREKLAKGADEATFQRNKALVKALSALGVGASSAAALAEFHVVQQAADLSPEQAKGIMGLMSGASARHDLPSSPLAAGMTPPLPSVPAIEAWSTSIDQSGEGASALIADLREHYGAIYQNPADAPPAIRHLLDDTKSLVDLSRELGFIDEKTGESLIVHKGATLSVDESGRILFDPSGGDAADAKTLLEMSDGKLVTHEAEGAYQHAHEASPDAPPEMPSEERVYAYAPEDPGPLTRMPTDISMDAPEPAAYSVPPPAAESVPEAPAQEAAPAPKASSSEVFTNIHDVKVDLRAPHAYSSVEADGSKVISIVGGKGNDSFYAAQQYVETHADYFAKHPGTIVRFSAVDIDTVTGVERPYTGGFTLGPNGVMPIIDAELPPPPPAETFTDRLDFTYKKP